MGSRIIVTNIQISQDSKVLCFWVPAAWTGDWPGLKAQRQRRPIHLMRYVFSPWKLIKGNLTKWSWNDSRGSYNGEPYYSTPTTGRIVNYRPQQKNGGQERIINYIPHQGKMKVAPPEWNWDVLQLSRQEPTLPWTCAFFQRTSIQNNPSLLPLSFPENTIPLLCCWTCLCFCHSLHVSNCNSLLFPSKPIFDGKMTVFLRLTP